MTSLPRNTFKQRLNAHERLVGLWLNLTHHAIADHVRGRAAIGLARQPAEMGGRDPERLGVARYRPMFEKMRVQQFLEPPDQIGAGSARRRAAFRCDLARDETEQSRRQPAQDMRPRETPRGEFREDIHRELAHLRRAVQHRGRRQDAAQSFLRHQHLIQKLGDEGHHPALRARPEREAVNRAGRDIDEAHRPQRVASPLDRDLSAAARDQQHLVQAGVPVRRQFPVVQDRTRGDGLAMDDVGDVTRLAKEIVGLDRRPHRSAHVRFVQENVRLIHFL